MCEKLLSGVDNLKIEYQDDGLVGFSGTFTVDLEELFISIFGEITPENAELCSELIGNENND